MTDAATDQGNGNIVEDDCPLCLEPLPPFWDWERRSCLVCCGKSICTGCRENQDAYLGNAVDSGSFGREEERLNKCCPFCRTLKPTSGDEAVLLMVDNFEKGELPLKVYWILGGRLADGRGVERSVDRGMEILTLGANKGNPMCQYELGSLYRKGTDCLPKSATKAKQWYLAATEQGHAIAEYNLALMLRDEGNDVEYVRYLRSSASKGYNNACYGLGRAYYYGERGLQKSSDDAVRVLLPAAERGHAQSMALLGYAMCHPYPWVPPPENPNFTKGMHSLRRAAAKGDQTAIAKLKGIEEGASRICFMCNKEAPPEITFLRCSRCRAAWYCSKDCQRRHWKAEEGGHKQFCIKWG